MPEKKMTANYQIIMGCVIVAVCAIGGVLGGIMIKNGCAEKDTIQFSVASLPPQVQGIVLAARIEAQKADVASTAAKDAEVAGKAAAEKAQQGEPLMKVIDESGCHYEGEWAGGAPLGFGRVIWGGQSASIGESFTGELEGWKRVRGVFEYPNPRQNPANSSGVRRYEGDWQPTPRNKLGDWHGNGILMFRDGSMYKGQVNDGKIDGLGQLIKPNGFRIEGRWRNNQAEVDESVRWDLTGKQLTN
jgi:hypothetical protein